MEGLSSDARNYYTDLKPDREAGFLFTSKFARVEKAILSGGVSFEHVVPLNIVSMKKDLYELPRWKQIILGWLLGVDDKDVRKNFVAQVSPIMAILIAANKKGNRKSQT